MRKAYKAIERFYSDKTAKRSGVPLINHINEGKRLLEKLQVSEDVIDAWCLHPLFQDDEQLLWLDKEFYDYSTKTIFLVMEYRNIANAGLRANIVTKTDKGFIINVPKTSPVGEVNLMLLADKVQNRKDFLKYQRNLGAEPSDDWVALDRYFKEWLNVLRVSEEQYQKYCEYMI